MVILAANECEWLFFTMHYGPARIKTFETRSKRRQRRTSEPINAEVSTDKLFVPHSS